MANINELLARAAALRDETALNSISPERAGGIMYDTLLAMNELWLQQGAALVISKIYASVAAMEADTAPVSDLTGKPLRPGQIVVIASSDSDIGSVYRYNGTEAPRWSLVGSIGNLEPVDNLESDSTALPLAAHQGKVLDGKISQLGQEVDKLFTKNSFALLSMYLTKVDLDNTEYEVIPGYIDEGEIQPQSGLPTRIVKIPVVRGDVIYAMGSLTTNNHSLAYSYNQETQKFEEINPCSWYYSADNNKWTGIFIKAFESAQDVYIQQYVPYGGEVRKGNIVESTAKKTIYQIIDLLNGEIESLSREVEGELSSVINNLLLLPFCQEIDINDYSSQNGYIDEGEIQPAGSLSIKIVEIPVSKGMVVFASGEATTRASSIVYTFNSSTQKYEELTPCTIVQDPNNQDNYYGAFLKVFESPTTIYVQYWKDPSRSNATIALGSIVNKNKDTIFSKLKNLQNQINNIPISPETASDIDYIAIGDSITDGTGATPELGSYVERLNAHFGFRSFRNMGQGGMSAIRQGGSPYNTYPIMKTPVDSAYVENFKGIISVSIGTNDYGNGHSPLGSLSDIENVPFSSLTPTSSEYIEGYTFAEGFRYNLERLKQKSPNATIVVLLPIHRVSEQSEYLTEATLQAYRDIEIGICKLLGIPYIDMTLCGISKWNTNPVWSGDNLHPNDYGYYLMTAYLIPFFKELISQQRYLNSKLV